MRSVERPCPSSSLSRRSIAIAMTERGMLTRKSTRQSPASRSAPPITGPVAAAMDRAAPFMPSTVPSRSEFVRLRSTAIPFGSTSAVAAPCRPRIRMSMGRLKASADTARDGDQEDQPRNHHADRPEGVTKPSPTPVASPPPQPGRR